VNLDEGGVVPPYSSQPYEKNNVQNSGISRSLALPPMTTLSKSFLHFKLPSNSKGSSFPAILSKTVPLAVVSLDRRLGQWEPR